MSFQSTLVQKKLEEAGFDSKMAYGLTAVLENDVIATLEGRFVTREYLDARLAELKSEIGEIKVELMKWVASIFVGACTLAIILTFLLVTK